MADIIPARWAKPRISGATSFALEAAEKARLEALQRYQLLDTGPEEGFDRITRLVKATLDVPMVAVSLVDEHRQWFKSRIGIEQLQTARNISFCTHTIQGSDPFIVTDARADERFAKSPLVTEDPHIRFYGGVPLRTRDGQNIGALCAMDTEARTINGNQVRILQDLARLVVDEIELRHLAHHDPLTELPNRRAFEERLRQAIAHHEATGEQFALVLIDVDRFKSVNDLFGHPIGDALMRELALRTTASAGGAFLARLGGDEFGLIVAGADFESWPTIASRVVSVGKEDFQLGGRMVRSTLSAGAALFPVDGSSSEALMANADAALYRAKADGGGLLRQFQPQMDLHLRDQRSLEHDLRDAVANHELVLHYQPQAAIGGGIVGFEALVRWQHPTRGLLSPAQFIDVAESTGLIVEIGAWVIREACREAASWTTDYRVAINLSPRQFRKGDLVDLVSTSLAETGLAAHRLELEITESLLIDDFPGAVGLLDRLKALGVKIALDDFGTGYSSLSYLQSFPFDKIKLDRAFMANIERKHQDRLLVRAILGLARALGVPVIAEGVETEAQRIFLASEGCAEIQGYLVGRPLPASGYANEQGTAPRAQVA